MAGKWEQYGPAAEKLYLDAGKTIEEIATLLPVSRKTIGEWCANHDWVERKKRQRIGPAAIARRIQEQIGVLVDEREKFGPKTADAICKLEKSLQRYLKDSDEHILDRAVDVLSRFTDFLLRKFSDPDDRAPIMALIDEFLRSLEDRA